jgi:DNA end-binding protein Ku
MLAAIDRKVEGQEITMSEAPEGGGGLVIDLMEALRASLEKRGVGASAKAAPAAKKTAKKAEAEVEPEPKRKPPKRAAATAKPAAPARKTAKK